MNPTALVCGEPAPDCALPDINGNSVTFSTFWRERPTVFIFLRHFNCPHCRSQVRETSDANDELRRAGLGVVLIGMGRPEAAGDFSATLQAPYPILCDPDRSSYRAYGLLAMNPFRQMRPRIVAQYAREMVTTRATGVSGDQDMMQLGGTFIMDQQGILRYAFVSPRINDRPAIADLLGTLEAA